MREREREREKIECVCVRERESKIVCMFVCMYACAYMCVCASVHVCVAGFLINTVVSLSNAGLSFSALHLQGTVSRNYSPGDRSSIQSS